jgi:hypothetical protein
MVAGAMICPTRGSAFLPPKTINDIEGSNLIVSDYFQGLN